MTTRWYQFWRRTTKPVNADRHRHVNGVVHTHSHANYMHKHALNAICHEPECKTFPKHKVHNGPNVKLPDQDQE